MPPPASGAERARYLTRSTVPVPLLGVLVRRTPPVLPRIPVAGAALVEAALRTVQAALRTVICTLRTVEGTLRTVEATLRTVICRRAPGTVTSESFVRRRA